MAESLFVIDAYAHIYQFFYAIRGLSGPDGEPVNAVYGFARLVENLRNKYGPDYMAVAFDGPGRLLRHDIYEDYKANRPPMPEDLERQIPLIRELLSAQEIPQLAAEGYEADDVLAAVAREAAGQGIETVIVTTDKDAEQLIDEQTRVLHIHKDRELMLGPAELREQKGLEPCQVVEMMALCGDTTDNIPGVPGIGPKTALKLIRQFGSVRNLYGNLDQIKSDKLRQKLEEHRDDVELAARLVKLEPDIPIDFDVDQCRLSETVPEAALRFYRALGFRSLMGGDARAKAPEAGQSSLLAAEAETAPPDTLETQAKQYEAVTTREALARLASALGDQDVISVDLETTSLRPRRARIVGLAFSWRPHQGAYVATAGPKGEECCSVEEALEVLTPILEADAPAKVGQNLKYDIAVLKNYGVELGGLQCDAMVCSYLLRPARRGHGLDALARRHLNYETVKIDELIGTGAEQRTMDAVPIRKVVPYACEDADVALQLCQVLTRELEEQGLWDLFERLEMPLVPVLAQMEWVGVRVDGGQLTEMSTEFAGRLRELQRDIFREAGRELNVNSPQQLSTVLFDELGLPPPRGKRRTTGYSTASDVLTGLKDEHPIADYVLRHQEQSDPDQFHQPPGTGSGINPQAGS
ncbi:MAG: DNA polymerase, partial [Planctomycetota bacterium]